MTTEIREYLEQELAILNSTGFVKPDDLPNIDLYMDQITTFMDDQLSACKRYEDDKILTKTMINNYAKNNLLPPPDKKKYSREHVISMLFIYYLKSILSINDIQSILNPLTDKYFGKDKELNMMDIYKEIFQLEKTESTKLLKDLGKKYQIANDTFADFPEEDQEMLHNFSYICLLSFDVYMKKMLIEQMIDSYKEKKESEKKDPEKKTSEKSKPESAS